MNNTKLFLPGDKLDISIPVEADSAHQVYKSSISDFLADNIWEITMPVAGGRIVLFQVGAQFDFVLYTTGKTVYRCTAIVRRRYRKDSLYFLAVELLGNPEKVQRRQFFRLPCALDMNFYKLERDDNELSLFDERQFCILHYKKHDLERAASNIMSSVILDISGGGIRISSDAALDEGSYIMSEFKLMINGKSEDFTVAGQVITCEQNENALGKYFIRIKFIFDNIGNREKIVRYVFEEERRIRRKEMG